MSTALKELGSLDELKTFLSSNLNVIICFSATWCGPCKASKPALVEMASRYEADPGKNIVFGLIYEENLGDDIHAYQIKAFPTYVLFTSGNEVNRVEGVNMQAIVQMIDKAPTVTDAGHSLGGEGAAISMEEARAKRLARLGGSPAAKKDEDTPMPDEKPKEDETKQLTDTTKTKTDEPMKDEKTESSEIKDVPMEDVENKEEPTCTVVPDPCAHLDKEAIQTLVESMGFSLLRAQKGLLYGNETLEGAIEWLMQHQEDADIDEPIPAKPAAVAQSYKCNECGKILSNMANLELHANKTGHSDFEESTQAVKPLTPEEKAQKIEEIKSLLKAKRMEREATEKADNVDREKQRRFMGKEMAKTREQLEAEQRKREAEKRRREKQAYKKERERLRAELAKDKAERMANKGKLSSKLGAEGYKPDGIQYDNEEEGEDEGAPVKRSKVVAASAAKVDDYISKVSSYRAGGDGGKCLKVLAAYVGNVVDKPGEDKFKTINMENKAFKAKVKPFVGAKQLLMAVGFQPNEAGTALVLQDEADAALLATVRGKLKAALDKYLSK